MLAGLRLRLDDLASRRQALHADIDPRQDSRLLSFFVLVAPRMLDAERCSIFILDPESRKVWLKAGTALGERGIEVSLEGSIVGQVISSGKAHITSGLQDQAGAHRHVDADTGFVTRDVLCVPLRSKTRGVVTGAIQVLNKKHGVFSAEDQAFLEEIGEHLQSIVDSVYLAQEAIGIGRGLVDTMVRAGAAIAALAVVCVFVGLFFALLSGI